MKQQEAGSMMIMTTEETATVMSLVKLDLRPIEDVLSEFDSKFSRPRHFILCSSLSMLLQELQGTDRLIAFAIIYHCYPSHQPSPNPFLSTIINAACNEQLDKSERAFLLHLLQWKTYNHANEILKHSAADYTKSFDPSTHDFPALGELQQEYGLVPNSPEMCAETSRGATVRDLLVKGLNETLSLADQEVFTTELANDPNVVYHCGLTSRKLPQLIEHNPEIAVEIVTKLIDSPLIADYLVAIVSEEMSLPSMEVGNRLMTALEFPKQFILMYITNCISSCEKAKQDKYMQNRLVQLVSAFLQSLLRHDIINVTDLCMEEVQAFCLEYSEIRETAGLFRLLKILE